MRHASYISLASIGFVLVGQSFGAQAHKVAKTSSKSFRVHTIRNNKPGYWTASAKFPRFTSTSAVAKFANAQISASARKNLLDFVEATKKIDEKPTVPYTHLSEATVSAALPDLISVTAMQNDYTGGAHGNTFYISYNYGILAGKVQRLAFKDVLKKGINPIAVLDQLVLPKLKAKGASFAIDGTAKMVADPTFAIKSKGLTFLFEPYNMGSYAEGTYTIDIPYSELAGQIDPNGPLKPVLLRNRSGVFLDKKGTAPTGDLVTMVGGKKTLLAKGVYNLWSLSHGEYAYTTKSGKGGYENEGQALLIASKTEKPRQLLSETVLIQSVVEATAANKKTALLVQMADGGVGTPSVAIVDPKRGALLRQSYAKIGSVSGDSVTLLLFNKNGGEHFETPAGTVKLSLSKVLTGQASTNPYTKAMVSGLITYRERIALPAGAKLRVRLVDVSLADAPSKLIAEKVTEITKQVPIKFQIPYDPKAIQAGHRYAVEAEIWVGDRRWFLNDNATNVLTGGAGADTGEMVLRQIRS